MLVIIIQIVINSGGQRSLQRLGGTGGGGGAVDVDEVGSSDASDEG